jgi:transcriptional regulator with XRE-family HTH domain
MLKKKAQRTIDTEGQRLLLARSETRREIAQRVSASPSLVTAWAQGERTPGPEFRIALESEFQIDRGDWLRRARFPVPGRLLRAAKAANEAQSAALTPGQPLPFTMPNGEDVASDIWEFVVWLRGHGCAGFNARETQALFVLVDDIDLFMNGDED